AGAISLSALVAGAIVGGRLAAAVLASGSHSRYAPLIAVGGALLLVMLFQSLGLRIGLTLRAEIFRIPPLRSLDTGGGFLLGAAERCPRDRDGLRSRDRGVGMGCRPRLGRHCGARRRRRARYGGQPVRLERQAQGAAGGFRPDERHRRPPRSGVTGTRTSARR